MIIYNITTHVSWNIHDAWLAWMKETYLPEVMKTGCFIKYQLLCLIDIDETEGPTYAIQFYAKNIEDYNHYTTTFAPALKQAGIDKWGSNTIAFSTIMQIVH